MKRDSLLYVVAGSLYIHVFAIVFIHGIKDSTVSMMDQKFRRLCRLPMSIVAFKSHEHCLLQYSTLQYSTVF